MWQLFSKKVYLTPHPVHGKGQPGRILILAGQTTGMLTVEGLSPFYRYAIFYSTFMSLVTISDPRTYAILNDIVIY